MVAENPYYKTALGTSLYYFVLQLKGEKYTSKLTGMLIDLSLDEIKRFVCNFDHFLYLLQQAADLLDSVKYG